MKQLGLIMSAVLCFQMLFSQPLLGQDLKDDDSSKQEIEISYDEEDTNSGNRTSSFLSAYYSADDMLVEIVCDGYGWLAVNLINTLGETVSSAVFNSSIRHDVCLHVPTTSENYTVTFSSHSMNAQGSFYAY